MTTGKCVLQRVDKDTYEFRDASTITRKRRAEMLDFVEKELAATRVRFTELAGIVAGLQQEIADAAAAPVTGVRPVKYPTGATGAADASPKAPKPVPIQEAKTVPPRASSKARR